METRKSLHTGRLRLLQLLANAGPNVFLLINEDGDGASASHDITMT